MGNPLFALKDVTCEQGMVARRVCNSTWEFRNIKITSPDGTVLWEGLPTPVLAPSLEINATKGLSGDESAVALVETI